MSGCAKNESLCVAFFHSSCFSNPKNNRHHRHRRHHLQKTAQRPRRLAQSLEQGDWFVCAKTHLAHSLGWGVTARETTMPGSITLGIVGIMVTAFLGAIPGRNIAEIAQSEQVLL